MGVGAYDWLNETEMDAKNTQPHSFLRPLILTYLSFIIKLIFLVCTCPAEKCFHRTCFVFFCFRLRPVDINLNWRETENLLWSNTHFSPTLYLLLQLQQCKVMNVCYHLSSFPTFNFRFLLTIHSLIWSISWSKRSLNTFVKFLRRNMISPHNIYIIEIGALSVIFLG